VHEALDSVPNTTKKKKKRKEKERKKAKICNACGVLSIHCILSIVCFNVYSQGVSKVNHGLSKDI
jgi:hypothetical protein